VSTSFQTPAPPPRPIPLHKATLPQTVFVDRVGDEWVPNGTDPLTGELRLECPKPQALEDAGDGPSYPWTLSEVRHLFGPLIARSAVSA